jgi:pimeloyl-ACP methyl ester carboxylesterase
MNHPIFEINFSHKSIPCYQRSAGEKLLIGLHGYADTYQAFDEIAAAFEGKYTLITFDLPFHGENLFADDFVYSIYDFQEAIEQILGKTGFSTFSMVGHSMGGRLIFNLLPFFPNKIDKIIQLTPAGLTKKWFANRYLMPPIVIRLIKKFYLNREGTPWVYQLGRKLKLSSKSSYEFMEKQFSNHRRRARLFNTWLSLYNFPIEPAKFRQTIEQQSIHTLLIMGKKDRIIHPKEAIKFKGIENIVVQEVPFGHFLLEKELVGHLKKAIE